MPVEMGRAAAPAAFSLLLVLALAACDGAAERSAAEAASADSATLASEAVDESEIPVPQPGDPSAVGVRLREYQIDLSKDTVPAGMTRFQIVNGGTTSHMFIIRGGDDSHATPHLVPGEETVLELALEPGEYRVLCDVRDEYSHLSEGMYRDIVVR